MPARYTSDTSIILACAASSEPVRAADDDPQTHRYDSTHVSASSQPEASSLYSSAEAHTRYTHSQIYASPILTERSADPIRSPDPQVSPNELHSNTAPIQADERGPASSKSCTEHPQLSKRLYSCLRIRASPWTQTHAPAHSCANLPALRRHICQRAMAPSAPPKRSKRASLVEGRRR